MKKYFLLSAFALVSVVSFCQLPFEGKIVYKMVDGEKMKEASIEAWFGKGKIKAIVNETNEDRKPKEDLLIDFTNGIIYYLDTDNKTYRIDSLANKKSFPGLTKTPAKNKTITGYPATAYGTIDTSDSEFLGKMEMNFWYADSIYFPVDSKYNFYEMIPIFSNGTNIGLGMEMNLGISSPEKSFTITALSVTPMQLSDSDFILPQDYTIEEELAATKMDTAYLNEPPMMDTPMAAPKKATTKTIKNKPASKKPVKSKSPAKSAATKPKH